jgi:hypothetical protein
MVFRSNDSIFKMNQNLWWVVSVSQPQAIWKVLGENDNLSLRKTGFPVLHALLSDVNQVWKKMLNYFPIIASFGCFRVIDVQLLRNSLPFQHKNLINYNQFGHFSCNIVFRSQAFSILLILCTIPAPVSCNNSILLFSNQFFAGNRRFEVYNNYFDCMRFFAVMQETKETLT